jgi:hypothetical protein
MPNHLVAFVLIIRITSSVTLVLIWIQQPRPPLKLMGAFFLGEGCSKIENRASLPCRREFLQSS